MNARSLRNSSRTQTAFEDHIPGARVRDGHAKTLFAILGKRLMVPIRSAGSEFFMLGHFPYRKLIPVFVDWLKKNPRVKPGRSEFLIWARAINDELNSFAPSITIAQTNDEISRRMYMALIGGANHEGFHRLYTFQGGVSYLDLERVVLEEWVDDLPYEQAGELLLETMNILEDIRIERIGCAEFPGVYVKMADLADFILDQEANARAKEIAEPSEVSPIRIALATLREAGLGYSTEKTRAAIAHYEKVCPEAVERVREGDLAPILKEIVPDVSSPAAIADAKVQYDLSARLAFRVLSLFLQDPLFQKESEKPSGGPHLQDYSTALGEALGELVANRKIPEDEAPYRPYSTDDDEIRIVQGDRAESQKALEAIVESTQQETTFLRTKLRSIFRALEAGDRIHGVKRGRGLSDRFLVDTFTSLRMGADPERAFIEEEAEKEFRLSIAAYVVVDESTSMRDSETWVKKLLYVIGESLHSIDAKFSIVGFQEESDPYDIPKSFDWTSYHRYPGERIVHHVYKGSEERWREVSWRIANFSTDGGTPMADGIEMGLRTLSTQTEGHRVLFVVTDGQPDRPHGPVVLNQIRRAAEAGIHLVGVGLGDEAKYVTMLFPNHAWAEKNLGDLPPILVTKITELVQKIGASRRGRQVQS